MFTVTLDEERVEIVKRGVPNLRLADLPPAGMEPGRPLRLVDPEGRYLASAIADPENELCRVYVVRDVETPIGQALIAQRIDEAIALRRALGLCDNDSDSAYRALNSEGDYLPGFTADVYGRFAVLYCYSKGLWTLGRLVAEELRRAAKLSGVVLKLRPKGGVQPGQVKQEILGESPPESYSVSERPLRHGERTLQLEVHLLSGLNVGLFTDMREHRRGLSRFVRDRRVLNTFSYTGALSVAAAVYGARSVTSVDLSSGVLKWTQANFRLNGLAPDDPRYRWETADVLRFLASEQKAGTRYDTIILDPPTFSAARSHSWSLERDLPELVSRAAQLVEKDSFIWVSSNRWAGGRLENAIEEGLRRAKRRGRILETGGLPPDYPSIPEWPEGRYLDIAQIHVA